MIFPPKNLADLSKAQASKPTDYVDIFWEFKHDEEKPQSRERDFLRLTSIGRLYMIVSILRPYFLLIAMIYTLIFPGIKINQNGKEITLVKNKIYYQFLDFFLCIPLVIVLVKYIYFDYVRKR